MEIKFEQTGCRCLRRLVSQVQQREQTQEVRLPEAMPDIGRVLGCWGQLLVRGKEWSSGTMTVSGGIMAWALYAPEDGSEPRSLETWIPFQMKWELPQTERDGFICVMPRLRSIDARSTSARKLMVRANISLLGQAMIVMEEQLYRPAQMPEDVQLLTHVYPMELPVESGEKLFRLEEEMVLPGTYPPIDKLLRYEMLLQVTEQKVMASRLVFKGKGTLRLMYCSEGKVYSWEGELPFSQFADLDRDYGDGADARVLPVVTNLEMDAAEGRIMVKCAAAAQFIIFDRVMAEMTEDAYSPMRRVRCHNEQIHLPARLDQRTEQMQLTRTMTAQASKIVDAAWLPDHPQRVQSGDTAALRLTGMVQVLYYDAADELQCSSVRYEQDQTLAADANAQVEAMLLEDGGVQALINGDEISLSAGCWLDTAVYAGEPLTMVSALEMEETAQPDPGRPSVILCRYDCASLWDMAKENGSTVEAIRKANQLQNEPAQGQVLLIPVS